MQLYVLIQKVRKVKPVRVARLGWDYEKLVGFYAIGFGFVLVK